MSMALELGVSGIVPWLVNCEEEHEAALQLSRYALELLKFVNCLHCLLFDALAPPATCLSNPPPRAHLTVSHLAFLKRQHVRIYSSRSRARSHENIAADKMAKN